MRAAVAPATLSTGKKRAPVSLCRMLGRPKSGLNAKQNRKEFQEEYRLLGYNVV
jgi:hypothetical protein